MLSQGAARMQQKHLSRAPAVPESGAVSGAKTALPEPVMRACEH
jgi:hypothetical protein